MSKIVDPTHNLYGDMSVKMRFKKRFSSRCAASLSMGMHKIVVYIKLQCSGAICNKTKLQVKHYNFMIVDETVEVYLLS
jgi:ribosomal protein S27AE